jgi:hypothetical protein
MASEEEAGFSEASEIDGPGRLGGLVREILMARALGVKVHLLRTHIPAGISKHEPTRDRNRIEDTAEVHRTGSMGHQI